MSEPSTTLPARMRVLVVDDEPLVRRLSRRMLEHAGYEVHEAADAREAIAMLAESGGFDVVVSDLQMPMDGEALGAHLASQSSQIPILFVSGWVESPARVSALGPMLAKPFSEALLIDTVRQVLARNAQAPRRCDLRQPSRPLD
jgi:CheY-like chemotaxis protein